MQDDQVRVCKVCNVSKPLSEYSKNVVNGKVYHIWTCHTCEIEKKRERYRNVLSKSEEYKAKARANAKRYGQEHRDEIREKTREYRKEYNKKYYEENKEYYKEYKKTPRYKEQQLEYRQQNKEQIAEQNKKYKQENHDDILEKRKAWDKTYRDNHKEQRQEWINNNRDLINKSKREYHKQRVKSDPLYKFEMQIRGVITSSFRRKKYKKNSHTYEIIGLNSQDFIDYLLQTFKDNYGYEWDGVEKVHIDHIIPLATATTEQEIVQLCYFTNLQLLKAKDNLEKHDKLDFTLSDKEE